MKARLRLARDKEVEKDTPTLQGLSLYVPLQAEKLSIQRSLHHFVVEGLLGMDATDSKQEEKKDVGAGRGHQRGGPCQRAVAAFAGQRWGR